jgi:hypothetical protein
VVPAAATAVMTVAATEADAVVLADANF